MLKNMRLKGKLTLIAMLSSILALVLASAILMLLDYWTQRDSLQREMLMLAQITGNRSTAALTFFDQGLARENLGALSVQSSIEFACIYDANGELFAQYRNDAAASNACAARTPDTETGFLAEAHFTKLPILLDDERIGTVVVSSDLRQLDELISRFVLISLAVVFFAGGAAFLLARQLQRLISGPIDHLAQTADRIGNRGDYSIRATRYGNDELGLLTTTFNQMLDTIEGQDLALRDAKEQLEETVEQRTAELRATQKVVLRQERMAAVGHVAATVSHELRNPLGTIVNTLSLLRWEIGNDDSRSHKRMDTLDRSIQRCVRIIDELLDYTREPELRLANTAMLKFLEGVIAEQEIPQGVEVVTDFDHEVLCNIDTDRIRQVVVNLLQNSLHALASEGEASAVGKITVGCQAHDDGVLISVADNGQGMSEEVRQQIFEPLFSTKSFGVGLGLPLVKHVVEMHQGSIEVESDEGVGTCMKIWLPLKPAQTQNRVAS